MRTNAGQNVFDRVPALPKTIGKGARYGGAGVARS